MVSLSYCEHPAAVRIPLPIDPLLPRIVESLREHPVLVIEAPPGAGKTTRVPRALLDLPGAVLVLEPRQIAARMAARRVAQELGEPVGETVGYQVRFDTVAGSRTRLLFLTEGVLPRRMMRDPGLAGVGTVVLDEFHERHLDGDLALALLRRLRLQSRPDLRLVVMSATLDAGLLAEALGAKVLRSEGRLFPLDIRYQPGGIAPALERLEPRGDVLVFLPGAREIRDAIRDCETAVQRRGAEALPLHGELPPAEQDRAVQPSAKPKVIFSTNVAESSITVDGLTAVIDSGLARVASDSPWTGLPSLNVARISQASAIQRAGRAARTQPGIAVRLYTSEDFARRPLRDRPEILRRELSAMLLTLGTLKLDPGDLPWIDPPPTEALDAARRLLDRLGATADLARYPVHPRLAKLIHDAGREGAREAARLLRDDRVLKLASRPGAMDLPRALLRAFPDRVAKRLRGDEFLLAAVGSAIARDTHSDWILALDIEDRRERSLPLIRDAAAIEPDWLLDEFPGAVAERETLEWNRAAERVDAVRRLEYERLSILEERAAPADASALLAEKAIEAGVERFVDPAELAQIRARAEFAGQPIGEGELEQALRNHCVGKRSFADLSGFSARVLRPSLDSIAPTHWTLPNGRRARITYTPGQPPAIASRLQDFFGMRETPRIGGRPLVVHLLAPNQRPVQMTQDLAGFWTRLYPQVRRELMRRYPRHQWPEDPFKAEAAVR
jgi:ATP-dependent helicase HrpB